ncbi:MAG: recombinase family protein [Candidatus Methanomethylicaceae archaeon]
MLYARVSSSSHQKDDLEHQVERLKTFARGQGWLDFQVATAIASGLAGKRRKLLRLLPDRDRDGALGPLRERKIRRAVELLEALPVGEHFDGG